MPKPKTTKTTKAKDTLLNAVDTASKKYKRATTALFDALLADAGDNVLEAFGKLWTVRHIVDHDIVERLGACTETTAERKERR